MLQFTVLSSVRVCISVRAREQEEQENGKEEKRGKREEKREKKV